MFYKKRVFYSNINNNSLVERIIINVKRNKLKVKFYQNEFEIKPQLNLSYLFQVEIKGSIHENVGNRKIHIEFRLNPDVKFILVFGLIVNTCLYFILKVSGKELFVINDVCVDFVIIIIVAFMFILFNFLFWYQSESILAMVFKNIPLISKSKNEDRYE